MVLFGLEVFQKYGVNIAFTCGLALQQEIGGVNPNGSRITDFGFHTKPSHTLWRCGDAAYLKTGKYRNDLDHTGSRFVTRTENKKLWGFGDGGAACGCHPVRRDTETSVSESQTL